MDKLRKLILEASYSANACHIGSALSCVDIIDDIYNKLRKQDYFIFSKASGVAALYAVLSKHGFISEKDIAYYLKKYPLASKEVFGVVHSVGSIAHGLSVACGLAMAKPLSKVYCLISDGEVQEGSTYEAALFARQHNLTNLYVICDNNLLQACGRTSKILDITTALRFLKQTLPNFENIRTIKGKGVSFMEDKYEYHYRNLTKELLDQALCEI